MLELDYADLDIIIDKKDNDKIYICDINNGPMCGGTTPQYWHQGCWEDYLKEINNMLEKNL